MSLPSRPTRRFRPRRDRYPSSRIADDCTYEFLRITCREWPLERTTKSLGAIASGLTQHKSTSESGHGGKPARGCFPFSGGQIGEWAYAQVLCRAKDVAAFEELGFGEREYWKGLPEEVS